MSLEEAVEATVAIQPKKAIPMHRRGASAEEFKKKVEARSNIKVLAIEEGSEIKI
jgi:L-ascorbate metabolism protein UlaG (beta-lactamase superfamily)